MRNLLILLVMISFSNCTDNSRSYKERNRKENPPEKLFNGNELKLAQAIFNGDTKEIAHLIEVKKIDPNIIDSKGEITFLSYAIMMEDLAVMQKLLELGADPDLASPNHLKISTPIAAAAQRHNIKMLDLLFKYNVNPNPEIGKLLMELALMGDNEKETIDYLIAHGGDVNLQGHIDGYTVIQSAVSVSKIKFINYFLDKGANPMLIDSDGRSFAYDIQEEINDGRLSESGLKEYNKIKERLIHEFNVKFPVKQEKRKGMEYRIKVYEDLSEKSKKVLGPVHEKLNTRLKDSLSKGVNGMGDPLD